MLKLFLKRIISKFRIYIKYNMDPKIFNKGNENKISKELMRFFKN